MISLYIGIFIFALFFMSLFTGSETGFITLKYPKMLQWKNDGSNKTATKFLDKSDLMLGTTLVGTNIFSIIASTYATKISLNLSSSDYQITAVTFVYTLFFGLIISIFAEILPKIIFKENAETFIPTGFI